MTKLAQEVRDFVAQKLEAGEWNFAVFYKKELVWSNDEKRVWCAIFKNYRFKTTHKWKREAMCFEITLKPEQDCWIDEIQISVVNDSEMLYSRSVNLKPMHLTKGDTFTTLLQFNIKTELS